MSEKETILIDADYLFGSRLTGEVEVNYTIVGVEQFSNTKTKTLFIEDHITNGRYVFEADIPSLLEGVKLHSNFIGKLEVHARVITPDGRIEEKTADNSIVSAKPVMIKFDSHARRSFKPSLPFKVNLHITAPNGRPVDGPEVELKIEFLRKKAGMKMKTKSRRGIATFTIPPIAKENEFIWLEARLTGKNQYYTNASDFASVFRTMYSWKSPSDCHLSADATYAHTRARHSKSAELLLVTDCDQFYDLHYEVSSRGNIVDFGTKQISANENDNLFESRFQLKLKNSMAPVARIVVYYIRPDNEAIADSISIPVPGHLENDIGISFSHSTLEPGAKVNISVHGEPNQRSCISIVDESVTINQVALKLQEKLAKTV